MSFSITTNFLNVDQICQTQPGPYILQICSFSSSHSQGEFNRLKHRSSKSNTTIPLIYEQIYSKIAS